MDSLPKLLIGSWIHDLGKLAWRGGYDRKGKNYETAHSEILVELFDELEANKDWKKLAKIASLHHRKDFSKFKFDLSDEDSFVAWCIYMADNVSASERNEDYDKHLKNATKNQAIENVFNRIFEEEKQTITDNLKTSYFDANKLENVVFSSVLSSKQKSDFEKLFEDFKIDLQDLIKKPINETTLCKLDVLLQNYLSFVPSDAYKSIPDISLYDHSKTVVVFAQILYNFYKDKTGYENKSTKEVLQEVEISLIGGDFPSIQKYIFNGIKKSSKITKRLRARSFLVQLIQEAVLQYVLDRLNLTRANVLISAGGKFVILANKTDNIENIQENINGFFIKNYPGLKFTFAKNDLLLGNIVGVCSDFKNALVNLFDDLSLNKFKTYGETNLKDIFDHKNVSGKVLCKYCGLNYVDGAETDDNICENCKKEIVLGEKLVKDIKEKGISFNYKDGDDFKFELGIDGDGNLEDNKQFKILANDWDYRKIDKGIIKSLNLYVPYQKNGSVKTFEEILENTESKYLVMIKGDVDNMSLIFKYGFDKNVGEGNGMSENKNYSLSRILTFSRLMELFFGYRLQKFLEENFENVYTIYSGGDDFVFVAGLKKLKDFTEKLYREFDSFVNNDRIHFSLGIGIFKDKTPINQVFKESEDLLDEAKNAGKQKISLDLDKGKNELEVLKYFGVCAFEKENVILNQKTNVFEEIKELNNNESIRYKLYQELKQALKYLEERNYGDYILTGARIVYMLSRNLDNKEFINKIAELFKRFKGNNIEDKKIKIQGKLLKLAYSIYLNR